MRILTFRCPFRCRYGYILIASDWLGLAALDEAFVADMMVTDMSDFRMVPDRCTQVSTATFPITHFVPSIVHFASEFCSPKPVY